MSRGLPAARVAGGIAVLLWWAPAILLALAALLLGRVRFGLAIGLGRALAGVGAVGTARRVYRHELRRAGRRLRAVRGQRSP